jgi:murein DD-endopeptidase MepM/ murein hydrolase activator NlpD
LTVSVRRAFATRGLLLQVASTGAGLLLLAACADQRATAPGPATPPPPLAQPPAPAPPQIVAPGLFALRGEIVQGGLLHGIAPKDTALLMLNGKPVRFAPNDGAFIIAFNRDAAPNAWLEARLADGRLLRLPLAVAARAWDVSELPTLHRTMTPTAEQKRIRDAELAQINAAKAVDADSQGWRQAFAWPTTGRISTLFGSQRIYAGGVRGAFHGGIDIARPTGTAALAPADGVVVLATDHAFSLEGNLVLIDHGMGLISALMHLSKIEVKAGDPVTKGQEIGLTGMTGSATGPHLHWGITWGRGEGSARIDPLLVAGPMPR